MIEKRDKKGRLGGAIYVLPNLLTTGNLFFGFFSFVKTFQGDFKWAAGAIILAAIFDVLDGRVARLTGSTSEFGVQYDSLCDLISFGLAPSFLMYQFALVDIGRIGWIICFLFLSCGALRLARFNVQSSIGKSHGDFTGLPIPMAAIVVATFVASTVELRAYSLDQPWPLGELVWLFQNQNFSIGFLAVFGPLLALAMVSNLAYRSHKVMRITFVKPFRLLVILVMVAALVAYEPELFGLLFSVTYALSGFFEWIVGWKKPIDDDEIFERHQVSESVMEPADNDAQQGGEE